jgi:hypothetical protein
VVPGETPRYTIHRVVHIIVMSQSIHVFACHRDCVASSCWSLGPNVVAQETM